MDGKFKAIVIILLAALVFGPIVIGLVATALGLYGMVIVGLAILMGVGYGIYSIYRLTASISTANKVAEKDSGAYQSLSGVYWRQTEGRNRARFVIIKGNKVGFEMGFSYRHCQTLDEVRELLVNESKRGRSMTTTMTHVITDYNQETGYYLLRYTNYGSMHGSGSFTVNSDSSIRISATSIDNIPEVYAEYRESFFGEPYVKVS